MGVSGTAAPLSSNLSSTVMLNEDQPPPDPRQEPRSCRAAHTFAHHARTLLVARA